jgi:hypothetical protein
MADGLRRTRDLGGGGDLAMQGIERHRLHTTVLITIEQVLCLRTRRVAVFLQQDMHAYIHGWRNPAVM